MKKIFRLLFLLLIIGGGIIALRNPLVQSQLSTMMSLYGGNVLGMNTSRAQDITTQLQTDVNKQIEQTKNQALNIKISDVLNFFNRTQKVTNDFKSVQKYVKDQTENIHIGSKSATRK